MHFGREDGATKPLLWLDSIPVPVTVYKKPVNRFNVAQAKR